MRTLVDIPEWQIQALAALCERVNQPRDVIVRGAIAEYVAKHQRIKGGHVFRLLAAGSR